MSNKTKGNIMIVDDNIQNLQFLGEFLDKNHYEVILAQSGYQAIDFLTSEQVDLILLDVIMPDLDGYETCTKIKIISGVKNIPVIFLTAKINNTDIVKGFDVGGVDYVIKPFNGAELLSRVKTHIELKKSRENMLKKNIELKKAYRQMNRLARIDSLTGLHNRKSFLEIFIYEINKQKRHWRDLAVIIGDIDFFKKINDQYGHNVGDNVLKRISQILRKNVRKNDSICRWGGEEFVILLPNTNLKNSYTIAEKIRKRIEIHEFKYQEKYLNVTMSFGIDIFKAEDTIDQCIKRADDLLYKSKKSGRNMVSA